MTSQSETETRMPETSEAKVVVERRDHVGVIRINRPEVRNVVDGEVAEGIESALDAFDADDDVFVVVLTGTGEKAFCAGMDLRAFAKQGPRGPYFTEKGGFGGVARRERQKPLVVAANGMAVGGGMEMALAADCVVADENARFGLAEVKVGLIAGGGGAIRLAKHVPRAVALEMVMSGDLIRAQRAYEVGLVNAVTPAGGALDGALELANRIAAASPVAARVSRRLLLETLELTDEESWARSMDAARIVLRSDDCKEGQRAFLEKRAPVWTGR
jgi:enoyl-CoA hydratase/carnithine racemase